MSSPDGAPLMSELRTEQLLMNLHQSINELEQSMRKLYHTTSANGVAVENISDEIRSLKREMLRNEQWNHMQHQRTNQQLQQQSMQFQQQSMQLQQQHNHFDETIRSMQLQLDRSRPTNVLERGRFF